MWTPAPGRAGDRRLGILLLAGLAAFVAHVVVGLSAGVAGALLWVEALLGAPRVDRVTRGLALTLVVLGLALGLLASGRGAAPDPLRLATVNLPIVALFLGVAFLGLARPDAEAPAPPSRDGGLWTTLLSVHLIGAVINLAMAAIAGDRMARDGRLAVPEATALARSYCAAAFWSPFFVAAAVAHTYAPGADPRLTLPLGLAGAVAALALTARDARRSGPAEFPGFAPDGASIRLTVLLLGVVLAVKGLRPELPMVVVVTIVTPPIALLLLPARSRPGAPERLLERTLPATAAQVLLFLAAGVFAEGAAALIGSLTDPVEAGGTRPGPWLFPLVTAGIVAAGYVGLHPVITIAAWSSLLVPLGVDPSLLAFAFLAGWAVGTAVSPLSGMNLFLVGRYGVAPQALARAGGGYVLRMLLVVSVLLAAGEGARRLLS
jgi:hypothetical protein